MYKLNHHSPNFVCNAIVLSLICRYASMDDELYSKQTYEISTTDIQYDIYMENPLLNLLVWGSLRLGPTKLASTNPK